MLVACPWTPACEDPADLVPATVDEDPSLPALELPGTRVHLETSGPPEAPLIVLLHGGPGDDYQYMEPLLAPVDGWSLTDEYFVVQWDQRGAGRSRRHPPEALGFDVYLRDLEALVDHFAPDDPVVLIGHSWGGMYAAMYMNAHPDRIMGAVLLEPGELRTDLAPGGGLDIIDPKAEWLNDWAWGRQLIGAGDHTRADYYLSVGALADSQPERNDQFAPWWRFGTAVKLAMILDAPPFDFTTHLDQVAVEILFIAGDATEDLGPDYQRRQVELFPRASLEVVVGAGHTDLTYARAADSVRLIRDYLARIQVEEE